MVSGSLHGTCRGGPYDGKEVAHWSPLYVVMVAEQTPLRITETAPTDQPPKTKMGAYRYILGQWIWKGYAPHPE